MNNDWLEWWPLIVVFAMGVGVATFWPLITRKDKSNSRTKVPKDTVQRADDSQQYSHTPVSKGK